MNYWHLSKKGHSVMTRYLLLFLSIMLFCVIGCNPEEKDLTAESLESSETQVYEVLGMDCPGCHGGLEKLVKKIPAVQDAKANWIEKKLSVTVNPEVKLNDDDIYDAIRRANLTAGKRIN